VFYGIERGEKEIEIEIEDENEDENGVLRIESRMFDSVQVNFVTSREHF